jgi:hypothetical protein
METQRVLTVALALAIAASLLLAACKAATQMGAIHLRINKGTYDSGCDILVA